MFLQCMAKKEVSILGSPTQSLPVLALGAEADPGVHDSGSTRSAFFCVCVKEVVGEIIQAEDRELERGQALGLGAFLVLVV